MSRTLTAKCLSASVLTIGLFCVSDAHAWFTPTPTKTPTPCITVSPSPTPTPCDTNTPTPTKTATPTKTPTKTQTPCYTNTATPTKTPTKTNTPYNTSTATPTKTPTKTQTPCNTGTSTPTRTPTKTSTPTKTPTPTPTGQISCSLTSEGNNGQCQGAVTTISLDGSGSTTTNPPLSFAWTQDCGSGATLSYPGGLDLSRANLALTDPGQGRDVRCTVRLTVSDAQARQKSCETEININRCNIDCLGKIDGLAVLDRCNVCEGDGQSCLGCEGEDITDKLFALDGGAFAQARLVRVAAKTLRSATKDKSAGSKEVIEANSLYKMNWATIWSVPRITLKCTNSIFCVASDHTTKLASFRSNTVRLLSLAKSLARATLKSTRNAKLVARARRTLQQASEVYTDNNTVLLTVPSSSSVCQ